ncbi:hypothetical protein P0F65_16865 [Sphingomonas sp. I4]
MLPDCPEGTARGIAAALSDRFDRAVPALVDGPCYPGLSIGLSCGAVTGSLNALVAEADDAMYAIKRQHHLRERHAKAA